MRKLTRFITHVKLKGQVKELQINVKKIAKIYMPKIYMPNIQWCYRCMTGYKIKGNLLHKIFIYNYKRSIDKSYEGYTTTLYDKAVAIRRIDKNSLIRWSSHGEDLWSDEEELYSDEIYFKITTDEQKNYMNKLNNLMLKITNFKR